jgi:hypothetical protein
VSLFVLKLFQELLVRLPRNVEPMREIILLISQFA